jgi:alpha-1,6-mannosyltransferase
MSVRRYTALGFIAMSLITLTSAMRGWPFPTLTAEPWLFQLSGDNRWVRYSCLIAFYASVGLLSWCWFKFCQLARDGRLSVKQVVTAFVAWIIPLLLCVPLFSGDVYVYWADGQLINRGFDPYSVGISALGPVPMVHMVHPLWRGTSTMYGPIFIRIAEAVARIAPNSAIAGVTIFRILNIAAVSLMGVAMASILKRIGRPVAQGLVFGLLNPVTLLHLIGGVHNDALMLGLLFSGFAVGLKYKNWFMRFLALALCAGAGAFKIPGFAGALVLGWIWSGADVAVMRRVVNAAVAGAVGLAAFELETLITGLGWGWVKASNVPGLAHPLLSPPNALAFSFGSFYHGGLGVNGFTRAAAEGCALLLSAYLLLHSGRKSKPEDAMRAFAWSLLVIAWTGPAVYPWYLSWGVAFAGTVGLYSMRMPVTYATIAVNFFVAPGGYGMLDLFTDWRRTVIAFITIGGYAAMGFYLYKRAHKGGYLSFNGPNWKAKSIAVSDMPSVNSPLAMNARS